MNQPVKTALDLEKSLPFFKPKDGESYVIRTYPNLTNDFSYRILGTSSRTPENKLQPDIAAPTKSPELSTEQIIEYNDLLVKIRDLPVFCFSVSDLMFVLEKPLIVNGKTSNDCYFYTYERLNRLRNLVTNRPL